MATNIQVRQRRPRWFGRVHRMTNGYGRIPKFILCDDSSLGFAQQAVPIPVIEMNANTT